MALSHQQQSQHHHHHLHLQLSPLQLYSHPEESEEESGYSDNDIEEAETSLNVAHSVDILHPHTYSVSGSSHAHPINNTHDTNTSDNSSNPFPLPLPPPPPPTVSPNIIRDRALSNLSSTSSTTSVKRKPLPVNASPLATKYSSGEQQAFSPLEPPGETFSRPYNVDSPTLYEFPLTSTKPFFPAAISQDPKDNTQISSNNPNALTAEQTSDSQPHGDIPTQLTTQAPVSPDLAVPTQTNHIVSTFAKHARLDSDLPLTPAYSPDPWDSDSRSITPVHSNMSIFSTKPTPPHQINAPHTLSRTFSNDSYDSNTTIQKAPKSPGASKLGSFFGWGATNTSPPSSTTTFSEKSFSPIPPSPNASNDHLPLPDASRSNTARLVPTALDIPKANASSGDYFGTAHLQVPLATPTTPLQIEDMETELKDISAELAASIRREMDLEDLVERLQLEALNPSGNGKRTSDYFSDSGTSSVRYGEPDSKAEELDRMLRKTEQDKAQMKLELTDKIQDERQRRKFFENQVRKLEEKASQVDLASMNSLDATGRLQELEATCEDLRRRLSNEIQLKDNFEDLLAALKGELQSSHNERDNLRDEIVPQLRARVEGLEAQAAEHEKLTYEQSKTQQELQTLKTENASQKTQLDMQQQMKKFNRISEDIAPLPERKSFGLARSSSVAAHSSGPRSRPPSMGGNTLGRSASVKTTESRDALAERVKDVEAQRDALHRALKSLLERQEYQNRANKKKIRQLETERDRALTNTPGRIGYDKEVANLREEINTLRRRAEDAIEQKWQCEKGLSGLKMDLDRAEEEIGSLRSLLQENDILIPTERRPSTASRPGSSHATSESLERAYKDLQASYVTSLERIKSLESAGPQDADTLRAMKELEQSLADAISERKYAQQEADALRDQSNSLREAEKSHVGDEMVLADELRCSAKRVEELAAQVRQQLESNSALRQRLSETIERGEKEQKSNAQKIMFMQTRLKSLEDKLMIAQQTSEEKISHHEDELRDLREGHNLQLQRMKEGLRSPRAFGPNSPLTPMFSNSGRSPRIMSTTSGKSISVSEDSKMEYLKQRVIELEAALVDADEEMEEVVGRMNIAQIEVMELQNEREEAVRETKRLQKKIEEEKLRAFEGRFATLST